ncbi:UNVERIFIED_ORG: hypothetical protein [Staphylococcus phage SA1]
MTVWRTLRFGMALSSKRPARYRRIVGLNYGLLGHHGQQERRVRVCWNHQWCALRHQVFHARVFLIPHFREVFKRLIARAFIQNSTEATYALDRRGNTHYRFLLHQELFLVVLVAVFLSVHPNTHTASTVSPYQFAHVLNAFHVIPQAGNVGFRTTDGRVHQAIFAPQVFAADLDELIPSVAAEDVVADHGAGHRLIGHQTLTIAQVSNHVHQGDAAGSPVGSHGQRCITAEVYTHQRVVLTLNVNVTVLRSLRRHPFPRIFVHGAVFHQQVSDDTVAALRDRQGASTQRFTRLTRDDHVRVDDVFRLHVGWFKSLRVVAAFFDHAALYVRCNERSNAGYVLNNFIEGNHVFLKVNLAREPLQEERRQRFQLALYFEQLVSSVKSSHLRCSLVQIADVNVSTVKDRLTFNERINGRRPTEGRVVEHPANVVRHVLAGLRWLCCDTDRRCFRSVSGSRVVRHHRASGVLRDNLIDRDVSASDATFGHNIGFTCEDLGWLPRAEVAISRQIVRQAGRGHHSQKIHPKIPYYLAMLEPATADIAAIRPAVSFAPSCSLPASAPALGWSAFAITVSNGLSPFASVPGLPGAAASGATVVTAAFGSSAELVSIAVASSTDIFVLKAIWFASLVRLAAASQPMIPAMRVRSLVAASARAASISSCVKLIAFAPE